MKANEIRELIEQRTETTQRLYNLLYEEFIKRQYCDSIEHANNLLSTLCYNMTFFVINTIIKDPVVMTLHFCEMNKEFVSNVIKDYDKMSFIDYPIDDIKEVVKKLERCGKDNLSLTKMKEDAIREGW